MTTQNTFRVHSPKKARRNLDLLNVRHISKREPARDGVYELVDIVKPVEPVENPLTVIVSEERLIGMCIGLGIGIVPLVIVHFLIW